MTTVIPTPRKNSLDLDIFLVTTTNMVLVGSGKLTRGAPWTWRSLKCVIMLPKKNGPRAISIPWLVDARECVLKLSNKIEEPYGIYAIVTRGSPWVTPSLLCKMWNDLS